MTEQEKLINVDLYGDGSRDSRLRAEYIYCDHADVCSVYKEGKCFRKTTLFGVRCEFGRIACVDVYGVREVTDAALIQDVLSSPRKYICF